MAALVLIGMGAMQSAARADRGADQGCFLPRRVDAMEKGAYVRHGRGVVLDNAVIWFALAPKRAQ